MGFSFYQPPPRTGGNSPTNTLQASGQDRVIAATQSVTLTVGVGQGLTVRSDGSTILGLPTRSVTTGNTTQNVSIQDSIVLVDTSTSGGQVDLPDAATISAGRHFIIKDLGGADTNTLILGTRGGNIDGGATLSIGESHAAVCLVCDGSDYWIV